MENRNELWRTPIKHCFYIYSMYQSHFSDMQKNCENVHFFYLFDHEQLERLDDYPNCLVICDDVYDHAPPNWIKNFYVQRSHHSSINFLSIYHSMFDQKDKNMRVCSLNTQIQFLMSSPRSVDQIYTFARQLFPNSSKSFVKLYEEICSIPFTYLCINLHAQYPAFLRITSHIIPPDGPIRVYELNK